MQDFFRMADVFMFQLPRKIIFGNGSIDRLGEEARILFGGGRVLLISDKGVIAAGLAEKAVLRLREQNYEVEIFDQVEPDAPIRLVLEGARRARDWKADIIVGLGGGSSIDTAKAVSFMATYDGDIKDCLGINQVKRPGLPRIFVPTTAGTGSELSHTFVLADDESGDKITSYSPHTFADLALIDPALTSSMPAKVTAESGLDAFSHALESFVTVKANPLSDLFSRRGIEIIAKNLPKAYSQGARNLEARYAMCFGVCMGAMAIRSSGIGAIHAVSYPVAMKYHLSHGLAIALMMPAVMEFNLMANREKYASVAEAMGVRMTGLSTHDAARASVEAVRSLTTEIGLPTRLRDAGVNQDDFADFARVVVKRYAHHLANNPRQVHEEDIVSIYQAAW
ncbi:MAG: iron-containing alcohol dehydrogenase [Deltaproteobacteria bacterium]|nr:iron-containing alcohol dehydrogenase [Deltaproteobacteria bacterium]